MLPSKKSFAIPPQAAAADTIDTATYRIFLTLILLIALALRLSAGLYWHKQASMDSGYLRLGDSHSYWTLAEQIAGGQAYQYGSPNASIFRVPLLPMFLAPLTWIENPYWSVLAGRFLGAVLGTVSVLLISVLARRSGGNLAAIASGCLAAVYPSAIGMSIVILSEMLFIPLMLGQTLLWQSADRADSNRQRFKWALATGVVAGLACLTRPSWILFPPLMALAGLLFSSRRLIHAQIAVAVLAGMCLTMSPWWLRNAVITDRLVLTTLQVGPSLLDGLRPEATGASDSNMAFMPGIIQQQIDLDNRTQGTPESTFEWRVNRLATQVAIDWARENPSQVLRLGLEKFKRTWSLWPDGKELASNPMRIAISVSSFTILLLAFAASLPVAIGGSLPANWRIYPTLAIYWLPCLYFTGLHLVFVGSVRYREPAVFLLIGLAGVAVARLLQILRSSPEDSKSAHSRLPSDPER